MINRPAEAPARSAWNPSKFVELGLDTNYNRVRFADRKGLDLHLVRVTLQLALDVHASLASFIQHDNADHSIGINTRLRYNFREGRDLWIVYNQTLNTDRPDFSLPRPPFTRQRAFVVKYTHTLGL